MRPLRILALSTVVVLSACSSSSDEQQIHDLIAAAEEAAEARDTGDVMKWVAADYADDQGMDRERLQQFLRGYFFTHPKIELLIRTQEIEFETPNRARTQIELVMLGQQASGGDTSLTGDSATVRLELRRQSDGEWRIARADRVRP